MSNFENIKKTFSLNIHTCVRITDFGFCQIFILCFWMF
nr:MAG TPA: hypothetical protein [Caudoviricetes sp.]